MITTFSLSDEDALEAGRLARTPMDLPTRWQGRALTWLRPVHPEPVHLAVFRSGSGGLLQQVRLHVFGVRYELSDVLVGGRSWAPGHFVEYLVFEVAGDQELLHRLIQNRSVTFSDVDEAGDYVPAVDAAPPKQQLGAASPTWDVRTANWPTSNGELMTFVGQLELEKSELLQKHLTWGQGVFLFETRNGELGRYKIVVQDKPSCTSGNQSAN